MNRCDVKQLINFALEANPPPPPALMVRCGDYYEPYYHLLYLLGMEQEMKRAVELGVHNGRGAVALALAGVEVWGVDHTRHPALEGLERLFPEFTFLEMDSLPVPDEIEGPIDILHIDTEHSYSQAKAEFEAYEPYLREGSIVLFDDLHAQDDDVLDFFLSLPGLKVQDDRLHPGCGYGVLIYE